eukprot:scaffold4868_cov416-Prasinococcus_capsulatus_cf.AAC.24
MTLPRTFRRVTALAALKRAKYNLERKIFWFGVTVRLPAYECGEVHKMRIEAAGLVQLSTTLPSVCRSIMTRQSAC